jgi:hypothetical protein
MSTPITTPSTRRRRTWVIWLAAFLSAVLIAMLAITITPPKTPENVSYAGAFTTIANGTMPAQNRPIFALRDNNYVVQLNGGQSVQGAKAVLVAYGTCVRINNGGEICQWNSSEGRKYVGVGNGTYVVVRTR